MIRLNVVSRDPARWHSIYQSSHAPRIPCPSNSTPPTPPHLNALSMAPEAKPQLAQSHASHHIPATSARHIYIALLCHIDTSTRKRLMQARHVREALLFTLRTDTRVWIALRFGERWRVWFSIGMWWHSKGRADWVDRTVSEYSIMIMPVLF